MNFCPNCGTKITNPDDQFCMSCGQKIFRPEDMEAMQGAAPQAAPPAEAAPAEAAPAAPVQTMPAAQEADLLDLIDDGLAAVAGAGAEYAAPQPLAEPIMSVAPEGEAFAEPVATQPEVDPAGVPLSGEGGAFVPEADPFAGQAPVVEAPAEAAAGGFFAEEAPVAAAPMVAQPDVFAQAEAPVEAPVEGGFFGGEVAPATPQAAQPDMFAQAAEAPAEAPVEGGFFGGEDAPAAPLAAQPDVFAQAAEAPVEAPVEGGFFGGEVAPATSQVAEPDMFAQAAEAPLEAETPAEGFFGEAAAPAAPDAPAPSPMEAPAAEIGEETIRMDELEVPDEIFEEPTIRVAPPAGEPFAGELVEPETAPPTDVEPPVQRMPEMGAGPSLFDFDDDAAAPETEAVPEAPAEAPAAEAEIPAQDEALPSNAPLTEAPLGEAPMVAFAGDTAEDAATVDFEPADSAGEDAAPPDGPVEDAGFAQEPAIDVTAVDIPTAEFTAIGSAAHQAEGDGEATPLQAEPSFEEPAPMEGGLFAAEDAAEAPAPGAGFFGEAATAETPPTGGFFDGAQPDVSAEAPPAEGFFAEAPPEAAAEAPASGAGFFGEAAPAETPPTGGFFDGAQPDAPAEAPPAESFFAEVPPDAPAGDNLFGQATPAQPLYTEELFRPAAPPEEQPYVQQYPTQEPVQQYYAPPAQGFEDVYQPAPAAPAYDIDRYDEQPVREKSRAKAEGKSAKRDKKQQRPSGEELRQVLYEDEPDPRTDPRADPRVARRAAPPPVNLPERDVRPRRSTGSRVLTFILVMLLFIVLTLGVAFVMLYLNNRPSKTVDDFMAAVAAGDVEELKSLTTVSGTSPNEETWAAFCAAFEQTAGANSLKAQLLMMAGDEDTDPAAMPYPAVTIESRPFILFIQKYSITISGVELLAPGAAEGTVVQLNDSTYAGVATAEGVLYQNLMPGQYECRVAAPGTDPAGVSPVQVTIFEIDEPNLVEGAVAKATVTVENCASDDAILYVNDMPVEATPAGGVVTLEDVAVGSVIRIVAQVDGAAMEASVTFDNIDVTTLRFENYAPQAGGEESPPPDSSEDEETEAYKFADALTAGEINSTLATFYASYLKAINEQNVEQIQLATASGKTSMESRVKSDANASNLFEFVSTECNTATIKPADENGTSVVRFEATFKYKYRERPEEGETPSGEQTEGSNVQNVELVYQEGKWLVNKMERKTD